MIHTFVILAYKESEYLERCIQSVLNQSVKEKVVIGTSTPNDYIKGYAEKYGLEVIVHENSEGIGSDYDFAISCAKTPVMTIAHQDDIYDEDYAKEIIEKYKQNPDSTIIFSDYYEIRNDQKIYKNLNLNIKKILLFPLRSKFISSFKWGKRISIRFGCAICCPAVSFVKNNIDVKEVFNADFKSNVDWIAWERLSHLKGKFSYIHKHLMGHRVHEESTTTKIINSNVRMEEDYRMFCMFWPKPVAKLITKVYLASEKSNEV